MRRTFDLIWVRIRQYFKHPVENIRQAAPIKPGRIYENYGYICKAVPYTSREQMLVNKDNEERENGTYLDADVMLEIVKGVRDKEKIERLQKEAAEVSSAPVNCQMCDFAHYGIPCPIYNRLKDGSTVCDTHKYIILKRPTK